MNEQNICPFDKSTFTPHITIMKMSKNPKKLKAAGKGCIKNIKWILDYLGKWMGMEAYIIEKHYCINYLIN